MENNFQEDTTLARWLAGELTPEELDAFRQREDYADLVEIVKGMEGLKLPDYTEPEQWERLKPQLSKKPEQPTSASEQATRPAPKIRRMWPWQRIATIAAAVAMVALGLWWLASGDNGNGIGGIWTDTSFSTGPGEQKPHELPDGSVATLNAQTVIEYDAGNWDNQKRLTLAGEAFFKTKKGKRFTVLTEQGKVEVVGTQFNVYARDHEMEVKCTEGKVQVTNPEGTERVLLGAGEQVSVIGGKMQRRQGLAFYPNWAKGESTFRSAPLERVFGEMERQYGITVAADSLGERTYSGKFVHKDLEKALRMVCGPMGLKCAVSGDTVRVGL